MPQNLPVEGEEWFEPADPGGSGGDVGGGGGSGGPGDPTGGGTDPTIVKGDVPRKDPADPTGGGGGTTPIDAPPIDLDVLDDLRSAYPGFLHTFPGIHRYRGIRESAKFIYPMNLVIFQTEEVKKAKEDLSIELDGIYSSNFVLPDDVQSKITSALLLLEFTAYKRLLNKLGRWY